MINQHLRAHPQFHEDSIALTHPATYYCRQ